MKCNKSCNEFMDENAEYTKRSGFEITEKEKLSILKEISTIDHK